MKKILLLLLTTFMLAQPDLIIDVDDIQLISYTSYDQCYLNEGYLTGTGDRQIIRYTTTVGNVGYEDWHIGNRPSSPDESNDDDAWFWDDCHEHWHGIFTKSTLYHYNQIENCLEPTNIGFDFNGWCTMDFANIPYNMNPDGYQNPGCSFNYGCIDQGISTGCAMVYHNSIDGQWIDVTGLPNGFYILEVSVNSNNFFQYEELTYENNTKQVQFELNDYDNVIGNPLEFNLTHCEPEYFGDINSDTQINISDIVLLVEWILNENWNESGDINQDGLINITDVVMLVDLIVNR